MTIDHNTNGGVFKSFYMINFCSSIMTVFNIMIINLISITMITIHNKTGGLTAQCFVVKPCARLN